MTTEPLYIGEDKRLIGHIEVPDGQRMVSIKHRTGFWCVDYEPIPEPYVFPDWMPEGWWLHWESTDFGANWILCRYEDLTYERFEGEQSRACLNGWPKFIPPMPEQYAGKPMRVVRSPHSH